MFWKGKCQLFPKSIMFIYEICFPRSLHIIFWKTYENSPFSLKIHGFTSYMVPSIQICTLHNYTRTSPALAQGMGAPQAGWERSGNTVDASGRYQGTNGDSALAPVGGATNVSVTDCTTRSDHPGARGRGLRPQNPAGDADVMTGFDS